MMVYLEGINRSRKKAEDISMTNYERLPDGALSGAQELCARYPGGVRFCRNRISLCGGERSSHGRQVLFAKAATRANTLDIIKIGRRYHDEQACSECGCRGDSH